jgi:hypothetical protein
MIDHRRRARAFGAVALIGLGTVADGCAEESGDANSAGAHVTKADGGGRSEAEAGAPADASFPVPEDAGRGVTSKLPIGAPCKPSDGWQEPTPNSQGQFGGNGPRTWIDLPPGVGWCDTDPLQVSYPNYSWTMTCFSDADCPVPSACNRLIQDRIGSCRIPCNADAECALPNGAPSAGFRMGCLCGTALADGSCFCGAAVIGEPRPFEGGTPP